MKRTLVEVLLDLVSNFAMSVFKAIDKFPPTTNPKDVSKQAAALYKVVHKPDKKDYHLHINQLSC
ncbi:hypothetical protein J8L10_06815 [Bacteroides fragilis]|uniref:hypothetical protein n=1 Tax=Bacteroides fragilis TaxID=817 RepID=UPI00202E8965|nr:hypothetical protein [Bacteroides fragilis]MCM0194800.1 hypothetical protein [Bacteroides fragilis]MCM0241599.1 hypothetical protein [Bacteroides fragilis]